MTVWMIEIEENEKIRIKIAKSKRVAVKALEQECPGLTFSSAAKINNLLSFCYDDGETVFARIVETEVLE